jgi:Domain of unknown function (DUF4345)
MLKWKNVQLLFGAVIVAIVALEYGIAPGKTVKLLLGINTTNSNLNQVFRASMGLYLGMAAFWISAVFNANLWRAATLSSIFFFGGLAIGRIIGILSDGWPNVYFTTGVVFELILFIWAMINLKKYY